MVGKVVWHFRGCCGLACRLSRAFALYREAAALAAALEQRQRDSPFDLVQSSDYRLAGMCITARPHRTHVVRCSSTENVIDQALGVRPGLDSYWNGRRERQWLQSVDFVYAPSRLLADYQQSHHGVPVGVVRPPFFFETETAERVSLPFAKSLSFSLWEYRPCEGIGCGCRCVDSGVAGRAPI